MFQSAAACPGVTDEAYPVPPPGPAVPSAWADVPFAPYLTHPYWPIGGGGVLSYDLSVYWTAGKDFTFTNASTVRVGRVAITGMCVDLCVEENTTCSTPYLLLPFPAMLDA